MLFSIIIPVYNSESFLRSAIDSVINQTIDFKKNVEVILVNDGSNDNSEMICKEYRDRFPDNIKYFFTENNGPAAARNIGIKHISDAAKYIGFLDSDDILALSAIEKVYSFFEKYKDEVNFVVIPIKYFGSIKKPHNLNYKFDKGSRIIDIKKEYTAIQFYIGGTFFKKEVFEGNNGFNESIRMGEDALLVNSLLLDTPKYGVVTGTEYLYRRSNSHQSLVDSSWYKKSRYSAFIEDIYLQLIKKSIQNYGCVLPYIQYLIAFHLRLYLLQDKQEAFEHVLDNKEKLHFIHLVIKVLSYIDDQIIMALPTKPYYREFLIYLKHNGWPYKIPDQYNTEEIRDEKVIITNIKWKGFFMVFHLSFNHDLYVMDQKDFIFIKGFNKTILTKRISIGDKITIWGTEIRSSKNTELMVKIPFYLIAFQFGINIKGKEIMLNRVNILEKSLKRINSILKKQ